ncbi:hypothetical protein B0H16DRAFT_1893824 [Mycena metata]|uniref:Uncharacterized protein n=1 Tax=Mycena metata TaxID=1033252 RepID=A0AAD7HVY5_9AGAR|nr:hypothetical protein B0H16DRAFT_1893824 [Mycena metata]
MSDQCALGPDGKLLDAKDIVFFNDPDDLHPLPKNPKPVLVPTSIKKFFGSADGPRRSSRVSVPSARTTDPNNAESLKRKADTTLTSHRPSQRTRHATETDNDDSGVDTEPEDNDVDMVDISSSSSVAGDPEEEDEEEEEQEEGEDIITAYLQTRAFGEADIEAMKRRPKASKIADIQLIFAAEDVTDPSTGKVVSGHWCKLCKKAKLPFKDAFFAGGVSTRRAHIKRALLEQTHTIYVDEIQEKLLTQRGVAVLMTTLLSTLW